VPRWARLRRCTLALPASVSGRATVSELAEWAMSLPQVVYGDGAVIFREGERHEELLILERGAVRVTTGGLQVAIVDQPGAFLGEMSVLLSGVGGASVTAIGESAFRRSDDPLALMRAEPEVAIAIATAVARRLGLVTGYLSDLQRQYADRSDHLGVIAEVLQSLTQNRKPTIEPGSERELEAPY
jgi:CRP/FNR family transcriptional regulator, cyclic AMP receptor protein